MIAQFDSETPLDFCYDQGSNKNEITILQSDEMILLDQISIKWFLEECRYV